MLQDSIKNNVQAQRLELVCSPQQLRTRDVAATVRMGRYALSLLCAHVIHPACSLSLQQLWRTTGVRGLFRGVGPSVLRAFLVSGSRFSAYESVLNLLRTG